MFYYYYIPHFVGDGIIPPASDAYNYIPVYRPRRR